MEHTEKHLRRHRMDGETSDRSSQPSVQSFEQGSSSLRSGRCRHQGEDEEELSRIDSVSSIASVVVLTKMQLRDRIVKSIRSA